MAQWLKLCQLLVDWQSPRGTLTPGGPGGMVDFFLRRGGQRSPCLVISKGGRRISIHSLSACGETRPTTNEGGGGRPKKEELY